MVTPYSNALQGCQYDPVAVEWLDKSINSWLAFLNSPGWYDRGYSNFIKHRHAIEGWAEQLKDAWFNGRWYQAGQLMGEITYLLMEYEGNLLFNQGY